MEEKSSTQRLFMDLSHLIFQKNYSMLKELGIYPGQMALFKLLAEEGGLSQREIAKRLHITPPSVTVSIRRMEKSGMVVRRPDEKDQRITRIYLTETGKQVNIQVKRLLKKNEEELFKDFEESEICLLRRFFQHMIRNVKETMPKEADNMDFHGICKEEDLCGKNNMEGEKERIW